MTTLSLASVLAESARRRPQHLALIEGERRITFAQMWEQARVQAAALIDAGVRPGDRVALMAPNVAEFPQAYYAILAAGAVVVPVHLLLSAEEVEHVLRDSGTTLLLCHVVSAQVGLTAGAAAGVKVLTLGPALTQLASVPRFEDLAAGQTPIPLHVTRDAEDPAVIFYTSGTTGRPKGAVLNHLNLVMNATVNAFDANDANQDDIALAALPLFHAFGQTVSLNTMWRVGATVVLQPRFDAAEAIDLMVRENVNSFHGVPTMYVRLVEVARDAAALPQLKIAVSGGASLPLTVLEAFEKTFGTPVYEGYGLSETSPTATTNQPHFGTKPGSVGHTIWGVDVEIARAEIDERIELLPVGELGEIVIRGHNVFSGYLGLPEATAEALVDGWFRSGDLGTKDAEGFITIVDRKKDIIIRGGFNVYPREVEEVLLRYPGVGEAAVIGLPDAVHGEEICAVLVADPAAEGPLDVEKLVEFCKEHLGRHKYPRRIEVVDELPLGPSLKVLKRELRQRYR